MELLQISRFLINFMLLACVLPVHVFASDPDAACTDDGGTCQENTLPCAAGYQAGLCGGGVTRQCCLSDPDAACTDDGGTCQENTLPCAAGYQAGLCGGGVTRQCCLSDPDAACTDDGGTCQENTLPCAAGYQAGLCGGGVTRQCCLSDPDAACTDDGGTCQENTLPCAAGYQAGLCGGGVTRQCCPSDPDSACTGSGGSCKENTMSCDGEYSVGLCGGGTTRQCCLPTAGCDSVNIITRQEWGARSPTAQSTMQVPVSMVFVHHTDTSECTDQSSCSSRVRNIQNYHMDTRQWSDIGYSFLVGGDGNVYEGRGWGNQGAHTLDFNRKAFGVSMIGDFQSTLPNSRALLALKNLISCGVELGKITSGYCLYGHRDAVSTQCPGDSLYAEIQSWPAYCQTSPAK